MSVGIVLVSSCHSDVFRDHMIHTAITLQVVKAEGGEVMCCYETEQDEHVPPLVTGANEIHPPCSWIQVTTNY